MQGFRREDYENHSYDDVPEGLGFDFAKVPFFLKSHEAFMEEILTDLTVMRHGNFWFTDPANSSPSECHVSALL